MREPTPDHIAFEWHRSYMAGEQPERHEAEPQCGFYSRRFVKGGPLIPVRIYLEREFGDSGDMCAPEVMRAEVLGSIEDPVKHWLYLKPISEDDYHALVSHHENLPEMKATNAVINLTAKAMRP